MIGNKARREVMERDQRECQFFCGGQPATEIAHFDHQGIGGLPAGHWKNQPPNLAAACGECHRKVHGNWRWIEFEPAEQRAPGAGIPACIGTMEVLDPDGHVVSGHDLWFYNRWRKQAAIMAAQSLQTVSTIDCTIGEMMHDLRDGAEFLVGARSFEEHISGLGWDSIKANEIADVFEWACSLECGWPAEVNYSKMELLYGVDWGEHSPEPFIESAAGGDSYSTLQADLIKAGLKQAQYRLYAVVGPPLVGATRVVYVRTRQEEKLIQLALDRECAAIKINALKGRLGYRRGKKGGIFDRATGTMVGLLTLEEWEGGKNGH